MPLYEYKCKECGHRFDELLEKMEDKMPCEECGSDAVIQFSSIAVHIWEPKVFEHIDTKPMLIESKKQLKKECEKRGLVPLALE